MEHKPLFEQMTRMALTLGAYKAEVVPVALVQTDVAFRAMCERNACGNFGRNWMCPPFVGGIQTLIDKLKRYEYALVYQTVGQLEDSYDFEGMVEAAATHNQLMLALRSQAEGLSLPQTLHLGAGGCHVCEVCARRETQPCRHPDQAVASLEAYGVNVSKLAELAHMKYINGQNTVTYFGAMLFCV